MMTKNLPIALPYAANFVVVVFVCEDFRNYWYLHFGTVAKYKHIHIYIRLYSYTPTFIKIYID